jgi:hypothetical protein
MLAQNPNDVVGGVGGGFVGQVAWVQRGAAYGATPTRVPDEKLNPRSSEVKAVGSPDAWLMKVAVGGVLPGVTPKYA